MWRSASAGIVWRHSNDEAPAYKPWTSSTGEPWPCRVKATRWPRQRISPGSPPSAVYLVPLHRCRLAAPSPFGRIAPRRRRAAPTTPIRFSGQKVSSIPDGPGASRGAPSSRADEREQDGGRRPALGGALERDRAAVLLDDALAEREADAGAARLGGEEDLEHARQDVGRDGRARRCAGGSATCRSRSTLDVSVRSLPSGAASVALTSRLMNTCASCCASIAQLRGRRARPLEQDGAALEQAALVLEHLVPHVVRIARLRGGSGSGVRTRAAR